MNEKVDLVIHTGDITNAISMENFSKLNVILLVFMEIMIEMNQGLKEVISKYNFKILEPPHEISINGRKKINET